MIIKASHRKLYVRVFEWHTGFILQKHFSKVEIVSSISKTGKTILLIGNHFSWWDGFIAHHVNNSLFKKNFYFMMLEEELKKRMFLSSAGGFSINKNSRSMIESLRYASSILECPGNCLLLYPQGEIQSSYKFPVKFEKGWLRVVKKVNESFSMIFIVSLIDYFSNKKPSIYVYLKEYPYKETDGFNEIESAFNQHLMDSIEKQAQNK